ncbi:hypothetical protein DFH09DRAFT_1196133 [Mycena vulgaris]|nr:hypothetical protein DFH09DRAFT_1196133 [Mycena vulgaris]
MSFGKFYFLKFLLLALAFDAASGEKCGGQTCTSKQCCITIGIPPIESKNCGNLGQLGDLCGSEFVCACAPGLVCNITRHRCEKQESIVHEVVDTIPKDVKAVV